MTIKPVYFVHSMRDRWARQYGLKSGTPLERAWHEMAVTFNDHIQGKATDEWSVLRLPTGSGKTQGLALYCSLLSEQEDHPGVLIITKFTKEIDELVRTINQPPYKKSALAEHGKIEPRPLLSEIRSAPVLAITHSMYKQTLDAASQDNNAKAWGRFTEWKHGSRKLIVIDEALDVIEPVHVSHDLLRMVRGWIPRWMEIDEPEKVIALDKIITQFHEWEKTHPKEYDRETVTADFWKDIEQAKISALCDDLCKLPLGRMIAGREDKGRMVKRCREIFSDTIYTLSNQSWYERKNGTGALNSAYVALPTHIKNVVIMDATALQSRAYDLLGSIPNFRPIPDNVRNYRNVRLHVLYGYQNSTYHLMKPEQDEQHFFDVVDALDPAIPQNAKFLFVTSGRVRKKLSKVKAGYKNCKTAYWGDINGKNEWANCTAMVIYGLPRLSEITPQSAILAFENWHEKTGKKHAAPDTLYGEEPDGTPAIYPQDNYVEEEDYHRGHAAAEVIQAINRVQCRKITDDTGGCSETDVYLLFNTGDEFEIAILKAIEQEMTGIQIITSHAPTVQKKKIRSKLGQEVIRKLKALPRNDYFVQDLINEIKLETGIGSTAARSTFTKACSDKNSPEAKALAEEAGYRYVANPKGGAGNKAIFKPIKNPA